MNNQPYLLDSHRSDNEEVVNHETTQQWKSYNKAFNWYVRSQFKQELFKLACHFLNTSTHLFFSDLFGGPVKFREAIELLFHHWNYSRNSIALATKLRYIFYYVVDDLSLIKNPFFRLLVLFIDLILDLPTCLSCQWKLTTTLRWYLWHFRMLCATTQLTKTYLVDISLHKFLVVFLINSSYLGSWFMVKHKWNW